MDDAARIELSQGVTYQALGEGQDGVLLSLDSGFLFRCNHTAIAALESLAQKPTFGDLVQHVASRYGVDADRVRPDMEKFVSRLAEHRLLSRAA